MGTRSAVLHPRSLTALILAAILLVGCISNLLPAFLLVPISVPISGPYGVVEVEVLALLFNASAIDFDAAVPLFGAIAAASSSILAIVFAISQIIITNIAERYTPLVLSQYGEDKRTKGTLTILVLSAGVSVCALLVSTLLTPFLALVASISCATLFAIGLWSFIDYFYYMLSVVNPLRFASSLQTMVLKSVLEENQARVRDLVSAAGDIASKALRRDEQNTFNRYVRLLREIGTQHLETASAGIHIGQTLGSPHSQSPIGQTLIGVIYDQFLRLFRICLQNRFEDSANFVVRELLSLQTELIGSKPSIVSLDGLVETRGVYGGKFYQLFELALDSQSSALALLVNHLVAPILRGVARPNVIPESALFDWIDYTLLRVVAAIVQRNRIQTFSEVVDIFAKSPIIQMPDSVLSRMEDGLLKVSAMLVDEPKRQQQALERLIGASRRIEYLAKYEASCDFSRTLAIRQTLDEVAKTIPPTVLDSQEWHDLTNLPNEFSISLRVWRTFYLLGALILFHGSRPGFEPQTFIAELWTHTAPRDADGISLNRPPIMFDPVFSANILLYGGTGQLFWFDSVFLPQFGFHSIAQYIAQHYFLMVAFREALLGIPSNRALQEIAEAAGPETLASAHRFFSDFASLPENQWKKELDALCVLDLDWNALLSPKNRNSNPRTLLSEVARIMQQQQAQAKETAAAIERFLPLDRRQLSEASEAIAAAYTKHSIVGSVVQISKSLAPGSRAESAHATLTVSLPRNCFLGFRRIDCTQVLVKLASTIADKELQHIVGAIQKSRRIRRSRGGISAAASCLREIQTHTREMSDKRTRPSILLVGGKVFSRLLKEAPSALSWENQECHLLVNRTRRLRVIRLPRSLETVCILLDGHSCVWVIPPPVGSSPSISLNETSDGVLVTVTAPGFFEIRDPKGILLIKW